MPTPPVDQCSAPDLMPVEQAIDTLLSSVEPLSAIESCSVFQAQGRIVAETVSSAINVPLANNSAMDGYALKAADLKQSSSLLLVGSSFAGRPFDGQLQAGQCIRIMTGGVLPAGADAVVMQENCTANGDTIEFLQAPRSGENVRYAGEDIRLGQAVLAQGHKLSAVDIGMLCSIGISQVNVYRRLKVALFSTGDELKPPGTALRPGEIYDSNRPTLHCLLDKMGVEVIDLGVIADHKDQLRDAFLHCDQQADALITSGGVSVGEADYTKEILQQLGKIGFWKLAMKPGKPFAFGYLPNSYFFGLPGNPVSALVTFYQLVVPTLQKIAGMTPLARTRLPAIASEELRKRPGRSDFQRGHYWVAANGQIQVRGTGKQGSGILSSIAQANCFILLEQQRGDVLAGENVVIEPYDELLR
ncbi:molybdopterin molybdotransferase MoeA [Neptunicella sp. SCSIO 80796]|uniref:molybdopterin molybdotransferase MoeA n=1 Tax=Neptunicella plasticusilytica TaxID=3117012 RepID=UPI003A4DDDCC